jgi:aryl-alcohol dehydrogenase-like predicted oxidoreductase
VITPKAVEPRVLRKGLFSSDVETPEAVAERLSKAVNEGFAGTIATASTALQERRRAKEMQDTANDLRKRLDSVQAPFKGLTKDQVKEVLRLAMTFQLENKKTKEQTKANRLERDQNAGDRGQSC